MLSAAVFRKMAMSYLANFVGVWDLILLFSFPPFGRHPIHDCNVVDWDFN